LKDDYSPPDYLSQKVIAYSLTLIYVDCLYAFTSLISVTFSILCVYYFFKSLSKHTHAHLLYRFSHLSITDNCPPFSFRSGRALEDSKKIKTSARQLSVQQIKEYLDTQLLGTYDRLVYEPVVDSTNSLAMRLAQEGSEEGIVVLTDSQTAGRGRLGRQWVDATGMNVLSSTILRPTFPPYLLVMVAALAVVEAIADTTQLTASIKWPNDVLLAEQKVSGILIETGHDRSGHLIAILGIGVNINGHITQYIEHSNVQVHAPLQNNSPGLVAKATTLEEASGDVVKRERFIARMLYHIEERYLALQQAAQGPQNTDDRAMGTLKAQDRQGYNAISRLVREQWRDRLSTLGRTVQVQQGEKLLSGVAEDVNDQGELLLRSHSGEQISISWGDVG